MMVLFLWIRHKYRDRVSLIARVDAESAIAADELLKPPPTDAPTTRSDNSGTELDENLSDLSDEL